MKNFDIILFDLDGTITDSQEGITKCAEHALAEHGITESEPEKLLRFIGPPLVDSFMQFYGMSHEQALDAVRIYRERYSVTGIFENRVYEGVPEMLARLCEGGKIIALATSKPEVYARRILEHFSLSEYFTEISGAELDGRRNAKWEVIEECLSRLENPDRGRVLMVGDRRHDIEGAKRCGVPSAGVEYGYAEGDELKIAGADFVFASPAELAEAILN